ncbi:MAG: hypothetical protein ABW189_09315 [Rickettsiales bacterium]
MERLAVTKAAKEEFKLQLLRELEQKYPGFDKSNISPEQSEFARESLRELAEKEENPIHFIRDNCFHSDIKAGVRINIGSSPLFFPTNSKNNAAYSITLDDKGKLVFLYFERQ